MTEDQFDTLARLIKENTKELREFKADVAQHLVQVHDGWVTIPLRCYTIF